MLRQTSSEFTRRYICPIGSLTFMAIPPRHDSISAYPSRPAHPGQIRAFGSNDRLAKRLQSWLGEIARQNTPISTPATSPIDAEHAGVSHTARSDDTVQAEKKVLVVTHEECLLALINLLTRSDDSDYDTPPSPVGSMRVSDDVEVCGHLSNTALAVLRLEWIDGTEPHATLESWGSVEHLKEGSSGPRGRN